VGDGDVPGVGDVLGDMTVVGPGDVVAALGAGPPHAPIAMAPSIPSATAVAARRGMARIVAGDRVGCPERLPSADPR
jgi:hypothetical protein